MVVDDHDLVREGLRSLMAPMPSWDLCADASDPDEALRLAAETSPDIVVLDISMPRANGLELIVALRKILPRVEVLVHTMHDSDLLISQALRAGARGYVLKSDGAEKLLHALTALSRGQSYFSGTVPENLIALCANGNVRDTGEQLTARERQIVKLVAEGNSNKRIAIALEISVKTVETHRSAAMRKVGAKSSADLAMYAARNNLVQV
jgi:DNA-binding NarL/FixJ family response regulator